MVKSVLALVTGITLLVLSAAAYAYMRLTNTEDAPSQTAVDTGIGACQTLVTTFEAGELGNNADLDAEIIAGLKASANADLSAAGEAVERFRAMSGEEQAAAVEEILAAADQLVAGCSAVGVPLPPEFAGAPASSSP